MDAAPRSTAIPPPAAGEELFDSLALVNTRFHLPTGPYEGLTDPAAAEAWLSGRTSLPEGALARLDAGQTTRLRNLREALRDLFEARISGSAPAPWDLECVNAVLAASPPTRVLGWSADGPRLVLRPRPGHPVDVVLALLAQDGADLLTGPDAAKIAACGTPGCTRLMIRSHAARRWCSDRCGNRIRAARHYADHARARPRSSRPPDPTDTVDS